MARPVESIFLREAIRAAAETAGCSLNDLTVQSSKTDPFRLDTPVNHERGAWLQSVARDVGLGTRRIHQRGFHYMLVAAGDVTKPGGNRYRSNDDDWEWLQNQVFKAGRWLGYMPFAQIVDHRNAPPVVRRFERREPVSWLNVGLDIEIPGVDDIEPKVYVDFDGVQPYKLVLVGEKSSLEDVLGDVAVAHEADLYLPSGELSDTHIYEMASVGAEDGRPMVVLYFSDCDPAGWQMPISVARKLQALKAMEFDDLEFRVFRAALTPEQARTERLPSTPLKPSEKRADRWREAMGIEQTEIDALAALRPDVLRRIARNAIAPFVDWTLARRVADARRQWTEAAQAIVGEAMDAETLERIRDEAGEKLTELQDEIEAINEGVADPAVRSATSAVYAERRAAVDRQHHVAMSAAERREAAIAASRQSGFQAIAHGVDGRAGGLGLIPREVERRKAEIRDRADVDLAAARAADAEAARWGRNTSHTAGVRERMVRELAEVDTWARESGEHWASERETTRLNDRQARIATGVAERRVEIMDRIAELERAQAAQNGNGDAA